MPSPALLYTVLTEEYESQGLEPPFPRQELEDEFQKKLPDLEARLGTLRLDPEERARRLDAERVRMFYTWLHRNNVRRSALCFSGGGIRSATFGLGLVQGLARHRLLGQFDYLSTVSGGGYLGGWLTGWIYRERQKLADQDPQKALQEVENRLQSLPASPLDPEPEPVRYLREYSRYMSPKAGLLSADTWTLAGIFLRNLFLNWLVLLPLMALGLMIPRISVILVRLGARPWFQAREDWILPVVFWLAVLFGSCAIAYISINRPSLERHSKFHWRGQTSVLLLCALPLTLMAILITLYWAWVRNRGDLDDLHFLFLGWRLSPFAAFVLFGILLHLGGFVLSRFWVKTYRFGELLIILATGALGGAAAWLAASLLFSNVTPGLVSEIYACTAAPLLLFLFLLGATLFVGLSSYYTSDSDREWLARCGAWLLIVISVRVVLFAIVLFGPVLLLKAPAWISSSVGGVSGLVTLLLGRSSQTKGRQDQKQKGERSVASIALDKLLMVAAPVFALSILVALSHLTTLLIRWLSEAYYGSRGPVWSDLPGIANEPELLSLKVVYQSPWWIVVAVSLLFALVGGIMGWFVDINRFSLHAAYRDRLIRAYLGASRGSERKPNPFTGFDEEDNVQMRDLRNNRPFHIVNMALNLVGGKDLAWQDRKAETFTASPLHAGSFRLGYRDTMKYGRHRGHDYTLSLGTAVAISGAAASPNMGYHSSPVVTFLLALFNVRLGWWLGNPGRAGNRTYNTPGPRFAPNALFSEAFGLTDDQHPYVYLSDGGHFENLALYEMILRRCRFIVVSDGGQDPDFAFEDLGNALSKIRIDLGVPIRFGRIPLRARPAEQASYDPARDQEVGPYVQSYCAIARICYSCVDSVPGGKVEDGFLLYIKPALNGSEPADVFHYARHHEEFPHESTADQLFSESQFESYRELGSHIMGMILEQLPPGGTLAQLFEVIESQLGKPPVCE